MVWSRSTTACNNESKKGQGDEKFGTNFLGEFFGPELSPKKHTNFSNLNFTQRTCLSFSTSSMATLSSS